MSDTAAVFGVPPAAEPPVEDIDLWQADSPRDSAPRVALASLGAVLVLVAVALLGGG